jgi:hypothetical protein
MRGSRRQTIDGQSISWPGAGEITTWRELFPDGRTIFYEGDDPEEFAGQVKAEFGIDVRELPGHDLLTGKPEPGTWTEEHGWQFHCPAEHLDAIYGSDRFLLGS